MRVSRFVGSGAGALGLLLVGAATGFLRVPTFGEGGCARGPEGSPWSGAIAAGPITARATLSRTKIVRGQRGEVFLHVGFDAENARSASRRPIDLSLVLDVSGSMGEGEKLVLLKRACKNLLERLGDEDRVAVTVFSDQARVVCPLQELGRVRSLATSAIEGLVAEGGTNLGDGLSQGALELRKAEARSGAARRLIVLTDGQVTSGRLQDQASLATLARTTAREGRFSISTVGLGLGYNETLLGAIAEVGGGLNHFASEPERLARIYDAEVDAVRGLVARDARFTITPAKGVRVASVFAWPSVTREDGSVEVSVGDLSAGRHAKLVARLELVEPFAADVASVALRCEDARGTVSTGASAGPVSLGAELTSDASQAAASGVLEVRPDVDRALVADSIQQAHAAALAGRAAEARALLVHVQERTGLAEADYVCPDGTRARVSLGELARGLELRANGSSSPDAERAAKLCVDALPLGK